MKTLPRLLGLAATTLSCLLLSACIPGPPPIPQPSVPNPTPPPASPSPSSPEPTAPTIPWSPAPPSSSSLSPSPAPTTTEPTSPEPTSPEPTSPSPAKFTPPKAKPLPKTLKQVQKQAKARKPNAAGHLRKDVGEPAAVAFGDEAKVIFRVNLIEDELQCHYTGPKPRRGKFVGIHMDISAKKGLADSNPGYTRHVDPSRWCFLHSGDAMALPSPDMNARGCLPDKYLLPLTVQPGEDASGMVVLDVPENVTALVFGRNTLVDGGWEYRIDDSSD